MSVTTKLSIFTVGMMGQRRPRGEHLAARDAPKVPPADKVSASDRRHEDMPQLLHRAVTGLAGLPGGPRLGAHLPSKDSRYVRFVAAVQALRLDREDTKLSRAQVERIMEAARDIFMIDDGVPREVRPPAAEPAHAAIGAGVAEPVHPAPDLPTPAGQDAPDDDAAPERPVSRSASPDGHGAAPGGTDDLPDSSPAVPGATAAAPAAHPGPETGAAPPTSPS